jgi:hypothetical protein
MYSANDTLAGGFPHSEICGSKLVCQLPAAYRRLQRPSSPVIAKASTTCTYSLDPIGLRTWRHENQVKGQACVKFAASQFHSRTLRFVCSTQSHLLFRQRNNMSTTTKLLKNSRRFELSNRKSPAACPRANVQATFGSTFQAWSTAGFLIREGGWWR